MSWKTLEKSGLEPTAPNRLADRKHCALSTQPNPHLQSSPLSEYRNFTKSRCVKISVASVWLCLTSVSVDGVVIIHCIFLF